MPTMSICDRVGCSHCKSRIITLRQQSRIQPKGADHGQLYHIRSNGHTKKQHAVAVLDRNTGEIRQFSVKNTTKDIAKMVKSIARQAPVTIKRMTYGAGTTRAMGGTHYVCERIAFLYIGMGMARTRPSIPAGKNSTAVIGRSCKSIVAVAVIRPATDSRLSSWPGRSRTRPELCESAICPRRRPQWATNQHRRAHPRHASRRCN